MSKIINPNKGAKQYICIRETDDNFEIIFLKNEDALIASFNSNLSTGADRYYELGPEVKIKTTVEVVKSEPVYRSGATSKRTEI